MEQLRKNNLNPTLALGKGTGGQTVSTGNASTGSVGMIDNKISMQDAQNMALLEAQRKNIEADTKLKEADAAKTSGVDTEVAGATLKNIIEQTENAKVLRAGYKLDNTFKEIQNYMADESAESTIESASAMARKLTEEGRQLWLSNDITEAQKDELKQMAKAQLNELLARTFGEIAGGLATIEGIQQRYQELRIMGESNQIARERIANELLMNRNTNYTNTSMNLQTTEASKRNTERTAKATERGQNIKAATDLVDTAVEYAGGSDSRPKYKSVKGIGR